MQEEPGPEWDHIDQTTLEEVETSWAHSKCGKVVFSTSDTDVSVCSLSVLVPMHYITPHTLHHCFA